MRVAVQNQKQEGGDGLDPDAVGSLVGGVLALLGALASWWRSRGRTAPHLADGRSTPPEPPRDTRVKATLERMTAAIEASTATNEGLRRELAAIHSLVAESNAFSRSMAFQMDRLGGHLDRIADKLHRMDTEGTAALHREMRRIEDREREATGPQRLRDD